MNWERVYIFLGENWLWVLPGIGLVLFALSFRIRRRSVPPEPDDPIDVRQLCHDLLETHRQAGDPDIDERDLMEALKNLQDSASPKDQDKNSEAALRLLKAGDHTKARNFLEARAKRARGDAAAAAVRQLSQLIGLTDPRAAFAHCRKAVKLDPAEPRAHLHLGTLYMRGCDLPSARSCYEEGHRLAEEIQDQVSCAVALGNLGMISQAQDELDAAEALHREALTLNENLRRESGVAIQCCCLGILYEIRGDQVRGERFLREARSIWEHAPRDQELAHFFHKLARNSIAEVNLPEAERYLRKVLAVYEAIGDMSRIADCFKELGEIAQRSGDLEGARTYWETALEIFDARDDFDAADDLRAKMKAAGIAA